MMMKSATTAILLSLALLLALNVQNASAFSLFPNKPAAVVTPAFVGGRDRRSDRRRSSSSSSLPKSVNRPGGEAVNPEDGRQSLDEFNALCQQVIAEERQQHYYQFVADCDGAYRSF